jgi:Do/DeqQ family serine protease
MRKTATILSAALLATTFMPLHAQERATATGTRTSFSRAVQSIGPAVVNIFAARRVIDRAAVADPAFAQMLGGTMLQQRVQRSLGSGVIVDPSGLMVTNLHVIQGAEAMKIVLADGREVNAKLLNSDEKLDLAVLQIDLPPGTRIPAIRWGDSDSLQVGDVVLAVGNPFGIGQSVSMGVVSAVDRSNAALSQYGQFIQTDAAVNPGNSGGALVDSTGAVVGINTAIFSKTGNSIGISFAIPSNLVRAVVRDIATDGEVNRPWLGAVGQNVTPALAERLGLPRAQGVVVNDIIPGSPAANAGLKNGDVILSMDGKLITDPAALNERVVAAADLTGRTSKFTLWREGAERTVDVRFESLPPRRDKERLTIASTGPLSGFVVEPLSPALNVELDLPMNSEGVAVVGREQGAGGWVVPLQTGDVLLSINGKAVRTVKDVEAAAKARIRQWQLRFQRQGKVITAVVG